MPLALRCTRVAFLLIVPVYVDCGKDVSFNSSCVGGAQLLSWMSSFSSLGTVLFSFGWDVPWLVCADILTSFVWGQHMVCPQETLVVAFLISWVAPCPVAVTYWIHGLTIDVPVCTVVPMRPCWLVLSCSCAHFFLLPAVTIFSPERGMDQGQLRV